MENIDVRMSNYIAILSNPELAKKFEPSVIRYMETAVNTYVSTTAIDYVNNYKHEMAARQAREETEKLFR